MLNAHYTDFGLTAPIILKKLATDMFFPEPVSIWSTLFLPTTDLKEKKDNCLGYAIN